MNPKLKPEHLSRTAVVYVRQSSIGQVEHQTESKRRQYVGWPPRLRQPVKTLGTI
jgi:hypothetical protein